ncbi:MAB_1171c family putative transporter [Streptomyces sp. 769]|uniref:MAB_1171c family putative transporter n=1 Tax=Streptomyces sp. 769 TaxID=1262452 RepID=UPI000582269C|nr:MAB_1171c family putative transporter [Streptomyces sp. 769]AJC54989.1 hypothetical protein GZL_02398 [Streptomyces sp. 769]
MTVLILAVAVAMTAVALWRLPGARYGDPLRRTLWGCSAGFAVALWARFPPVRAALGHLGIIDVDVLVKYFASIVAALSLANYSATSCLLAGDNAPRHIGASRKIARIAQRSAVVVVPAMVALFFFAIDRRHPSQDFAHEHAGEWGAMAFMTCFYAYLGASAWTAAYQWTHISRRAEHGSLRIGLALGAASTWLYTVYAVVRLAHMWLATLVPALPRMSQTVVPASDAISVLAAILFAAGASLPTTHVAADRWKTWRSLWRLHAFRRDLARAFPEVTFQPAGSRLREMTRLAPPLDVRLDRWIQEIGDAVNLLRHHATADLWPAAEHEALGYADPEPAAEALWIKAALESRRQSCESSVSAEPLPDKPFATSEGEALWLVRVQTVYAQIGMEQVRRLHAAAGAPCADELVRCPAHPTMSAAPC